MFSITIRAFGVREVADALEERKLIRIGDISRNGRNEYFVVVRASLKSLQEWHQEDYQKKGPKLLSFG